MKTSRLLLLSCSLLVTHYSLLAATPVAATISAVTVYADRAVVTRRAHVELPAGPSELTFANLPASLVDASLQVAGQGSANATIVDVAAHVAYTESSPDPREKVLEDEHAQLRRDDQVLADRAAALGREEALLGQIETVALASEASRAAGSAKADASRLAFADWESLLAFSDKNAGRISDARRKLNVEIAASSARINAKEAELRDLRGARAGRKSTKTVTVRLSAAKAGPLDLALTCALPNAGWTPVYDARLRTEPRVVKLDYFGLVRNATGEDWGEVALTLSTARPSLGGGSVEPSPWILDVARPVPVVQGRGGRGGAGQQLSQQAFASNSLASNNSVALSNNLAQLSGGNIRMYAQIATAADASEAKWSTATVDLGATSATFTVKDPVTLPGDNTPRRVSILSAELPAQLQYQSVPLTAETAFLSAYVNNRTGSPLLAGALNVFLDDNFVASGRLATTTMPDERFQLALGADEGIAIKRTVIPPFREDAGFTGKTRRVTYETQFTVTNNKKSVQRVMFKDVVPVSRDEKVVVKLIEPAERDVLKPEDIIVPGSLPKPGITREEDGRIVFRADVGPGKANEKKFTLKFTVEYPEDVNVTGLQ